MKSILFISSFLSIVATAFAARLTLDNWEAETNGKSVFILFEDSSQDDSQTRKPDWDKLVETFTGSVYQMVTVVDCFDEESMSLCSTQNIQRYPTIKWGDPLYDLNNYEGEGDYDSLATFAKDNLKLLCSPSNINMCDNERKERISELLALDAEELQRRIDAEEKTFEDATADFFDAIDKLQDEVEAMAETVAILSETYGDDNKKVRDAEDAQLDSVYILQGKLQKASEDHVAKMAALTKASDLRLMKSIAAGIDKRDGTNDEF